jgi:uncharacterized protein (DUF952 family)/lysophospholipase L1-like esterase
VGFERYVAIGDSQTEGLNDADGQGGHRGWADRFADLLAGPNPHLQYANLAVRGRLVGAMRDGQLGPALAMRPDVVTVMGGLNDMMRPAFDVDLVAGQLDAMIAALVDSGATVLTNTFPDPSTVAPIFRRLAPRTAAYNERIREVAARRGALLVDFDAHGVGTDLRMWSPDRIHANSVGHSLIAAGFADTLGLPGFSYWTDPLPPGARVGPLRRAGTELRWLGGDVAPWMLRRARGRSSGDGITAKRPRLLPVAPVFHLVAPADWPIAGQYRPPSLADEGFVHLSFADQVTGSANRHYADAPELIVVEFDPDRLDIEIRVEDTYGSGASFPHAYGPLPVGAAVALHPLVRTAEGEWAFSPGRAGVAASSGR